jgi:hypothetical protein
VGGREISWEERFEEKINIKNIRYKMVVIS